MLCLRVENSTGEHTMRINYFEEYPSRETLQNAAFLPPGIIFIAARSLAEFLQHQTALATYAPHMEAAYWPILEDTTGQGSYWPGIFSHPRELQVLKEELTAYRGPRLSVLLDFELPVLQPWLFLKNAIHVQKNQRTIHEILSLGNERWLHLYAIEWAVTRRVFEPLLRVAGLAFCVEQYAHKPIIMHYSSMVSARVAKGRWTRIKARLAENKRLELALGTVGTGVFGNEPLLSAEALHKDLAQALSLDVTAVTIFRLGGLTSAHITVLRSFVG